jgi:hypothetical protein
MTYGSATIISSNEIVRTATSNLRDHGVCVLPLSALDVDFSAESLLNDCTQLPISLDDALEPGVIRVGPYHFSRAIRNLVGHPTLLKIASDILPNGPRLDTVMFRQPFKNFGHQRLHRDPPFPAISLLLNLTPVNRANGATRFIKDSHLIDEALERIPNIEQKLTWVESDEPVVAIIDNRTFHAGSRNISGKERALLYWIYRDIESEVGGMVYQQGSKEQLAQRTAQEINLLNGIPK